MAVNVIVCLLIFIQMNSILSLNNRVRSHIPPLNLPVNEIPMFLTITIDDALHQQSLSSTEKILNHFNRNSEQIPVVYFISNEFTDYRSVQDKYLQGCEIAIHTTTHTTKVDTDIMKWYHEIQTSRDLLSRHADIPLDQLIGFRAPFLEKSDISFQVLNGINPAFTYDSTIIASLNNNNLFDWPYTLDEYEFGYSYVVGEGPAQSYPGLWEVPMYNLYTDISTKTIIEIMDYTGNYTALLNAFKTTFLHRLNTNKAPMGLYFHSLWFDTQTNVDALNDFIDWILAMDDTWVVTNKEVIDWINNPVTISQNYDFRNINQLMNGKTSFQKCQYTNSFIYTVESVCPATLPHDLTWDVNQLITTEITVSSTIDNELSTIQEMCTDDVYISYDMNTVYCETDETYETIRYMNKLYQCEYWTTGKIPGVDPEWVLTKFCLVNTVSFVQGSITPYGTFNVFENNVLDINLQINAAYKLRTISVIVDNINYDLSIFDSSSLVYDTQNMNDATLSIQFNNIKLTRYEIEFSFRDTNTSDPTAEPTIPPTMPSVNPSSAPTMPSANPSRSPTPNPVERRNDELSLTISYSTLISVAISVLLFMLVCFCGVYLVMKKEKSKLLREFEDNIVHNIHVTGVQRSHSSVSSKSPSTFVRTNFNTLGTVRPGTVQPGAVPRPVAEV